MFFELKSDSYNFTLNVRLGILDTEPDDDEESTAVRCVYNQLYINDGDYVVNWLEKEDLDVKEAKEIFLKACGSLYDKIKEIEDSDQ